MRTLVVIRSPTRSSLAVTSAFEDEAESVLKLPAVAGIDDGVQAAVEVTQPENDFEDGVRRPQADVK